GRGPGSVVLRTNRSCSGAALRPGSIGFHWVAGATVVSSASFRGPVRLSQSAAIVLRQLRAARSRSAVLKLNCASFWASEKVTVETSGPTAGPVPNADGAPGGSSVGLWICPPAAAAAPTNPRDVTRNCLRDFDMCPPHAL